MACSRSSQINLAFTIASIILSFANSLAFTNKWFSMTIRGTFIISIAVVNIFLRLIQFLFIRRENKSQNTSESQLMVTFFVGLSTFSDCTFDMLQGIILLYGVEYDNDVDFFLILSTWIGFGEQILDFIEDIVSISSEELSNGFMTILVCSILYTTILSEQSFAMYLAMNGLNEYDRLLTACIAVHLSLIIILFSCPCFMTNKANVGFSIISVAFSGVNGLIFTKELINDTESRAVFIITMAFISIFFKSIQFCCHTSLEQNGSKLLMFAALTSLSGCIFEILQGVIVFFGIKYTDNIYFFLIIGVWIGFGQQFVCFLAEALSFCALFLVTILAIICLLFAFAIQAIGIYIVTEGILLYKHQTLVIISWCISGLIILILCCCCGFAICHIQSSVTKDGCDSNTSDAAIEVGQYTPDTCDNDTFE